MTVNRSVSAIRAMKGTPGNAKPKSAQSTCTASPGSKCSLRYASFSSGRSCRSFSRKMLTPPW